VVRNRPARLVADDRLERAIYEAARAYERDQYWKVVSLLRPVKAFSMTAKELLGLAYYRLGRYREALRELQEFSQATGSVDQEPVIADCYRALGQADKAVETYHRLRRRGVPKEVLAEARIVAAGALADRGRLKEAIELMRSAARFVRRPKDHHVRQWYVLADLLERAGDYTGARELFKRVAAADPDLADAKERAEALG
jgi:tetratricopeptide (TPR) repeat protein